MLNYTNTRLLFVITMAVMFGLDMLSISIAIYWFVLPILIFLIFIVIGSYFIGLQFFLKSFIRGRTDINSVALTFDDGPHETNTLKTLDVLDKYNAKATFFCIGSRLADHKNVAREIVQRGHSIGNHSFGHRHSFPIHTVNAMVEEIEKTNNEIQQLTGRACKLFRPPFGVTNPRIARAIKRTQMAVIGWNVRSYDTVGKDVNKVINRVTNKLKSGDIVLLHDDRESTPEIVEGILQYMSTQNLKSVNIEKLLEFNKV